jgi:hypothetical protein
VEGGRRDNALEDRGDLRRVEARRVRVEPPRVAEVNEELAAHDELEDLATTVCRVRMECLNH